MLILDVMKRPKHLDAAGASQPLAAGSRSPSRVDAAEPPAGEEERLDPTRYGDWEKKGIAVDF